MDERTVDTLTPVDELVASDHRVGLDCLLSELVAEAVHAVVEIPYQLTLGFHLHLVESGVAVELTEGGILPWNTEAVGKLAKSLRLLWEWAEGGLWPVDAFNEFLFAAE